MTQMDRHCAHSYITHHCASTSPLVYTGKGNPTQILIQGGSVSAKPGLYVVKKILLQFTIVHNKLKFVHWTLAYHKQS